MKVLLVNNFFYKKGGSETVFFNTADLLREAGHEVVFLSFEDKHNIHTNNPEFFLQRGDAINRIKSFFANSDAARKIEEIIIKEKPDIAHAHLFWGGISPSIISALHAYGLPLVHTAHDYRMVCPSYLLKDGAGHFCERCKGGKFYNCALHKCSKGNVAESILMTAEMYYRNRRWHPAKEIDGIIFVSNFSRRKHIEFDSSFENAKTMVLYNCPGEAVQDSLNPVLDTFESYYLFYGRLSKEKGVPTLLEAFEKYPQQQLIIVGTGPIESDLKAYCKEKGMSNVSFLGFKTGKELYDLVAGAKYVCVPSECYENNPMTIVEAYSLSAPVIGAAIGGISEIVKEEETGYVFESGNVDSLVAAIEKTITLEKESYQAQKNAAYSFAKERFSREKYLERLIQFYESVIRNYK